MDRIPPELHERIISELKHEIDALKQLSLTNSDLTAICQRHLLREIRVGQTLAYLEFTNEGNVEIYDGLSTSYATALLPTRR
ncbi:hypothetical protein CPB83DRAFT_857344 [Crepidotus variabilis]|uniref:Uncharacterized protein n=1 Tax=Crepidotus variabilis TaxID=179855 RepID=A0A9P6JMV4_9AGAR|nr:hypothetical protein CPB83DRAFT_857344 [Crepidotus variabilis]